MKKLLLVIFSLMLMISCKDDAKEDESLKEVEALSFKTKNIEQSAANCEPENGDCTFISIVYPEAENGRNQAAKINQAIEDLLVRLIDYQDEQKSETPEKLAEKFIENYNKYAVEFPEYEIPWEATITGKLASKSDSLISMRFKSNIFSGGAHGYASISFLNFNAKTGALLKNKELFTPEFKDFVEKDFRKRKNIPANQNINSTGMFFEEDRFHLPKSIGFTENKVILHYNAYEIASYADGDFVMEYSKEKISQYLKKG